MQYKLRSYYFRSFNHTYSERARNFNFKLLKTIPEKIIVAIQRRLKTVALALISLTENLIKIAVKDKAINATINKRKSIILEIIGILDTYNFKLRVVIMVIYLSSFNEIKLS